MIDIDGDFNVVIRSATTGIPSSLGLLYPESYVDLTLSEVTYLSNMSSFIFPMPSLTPTALETSLHPESMVLESSLKKQALYDQQQSQGFAQDSITNDKPYWLGMLACD